MADGPSPDDTEPNWERELADLAASLLRRERRDLGLAPSALVEEIKRLPGANDASIGGREGRLVAARRAMRAVLDERARRIADRGAPSAQSIDELMEVFEAQSIDLEALDAALDRLEAVEPRLCRIVELSFFGGLATEAIARTLETTPAVVREERRRAIAFLARALGPPD